MKRITGGSLGRPLERRVEEAGEVPALELQRRQEAQQAGFNRSTKAVDSGRAMQTAQGTACRWLPAAKSPSKTAGRPYAHQLVGCPRLLHALFGQDRKVGGALCLGAGPATHNNGLPTVVGQLRLPPAGLSQSQKVGSCTHCQVCSQLSSMPTMASGALASCT